MNQSLWEFNRTFLKLTSRINSLNRLAQKSFKYRIESFAFFGSWYRYQTTKK